MHEIGGYEIIQKIGEGGMCTVYRGRQVSLDRPVAVKVLAEKLSARKDILERFERESLIIARLNHPNIIHVIDRGITGDQRPYFVMEYVDGVDLAVAIRESTLDTTRKLEVLTQVCRALSYAHRNGVIHRDVKPANVLIDTDGDVRVLDFGIAKLFEREGPDTDPTQAGIVLGTIAYMAPEQQQGSRKVTAASDLYSLGVIMYELFTGTRPMGKFRPPSDLSPEVTPELTAIIERCLDPDPQGRFASADEIRDHLLAMLQGAHLPSDQKERASRGMAKIQEKFVLLDVIKENRYGAVQLYQDRVNQRLLIIKKKIATNAGLAAARVLTTLKHKNIVDIVGASGSDKAFIIVMEYLTGGSLLDRLIQPLAWGECLRTAREICEGLAFAHKNRIVHGNLRPSNILFTETGRAAVTDFGLEEHYISRASGHNWYNMFDEETSTAADVFAAGTIFYQMLTGAVPVWNGRKVVESEYFKMLPAQLRAMILRMLSPQADARQASFDQVISEIDVLLTAWERDPNLPGASQVMDTGPAAPSADATVLVSGLQPRRSAKRLAAVLVPLALLMIGTGIVLMRTNYLDPVKDAVTGLIARII